MTYDHLGYEAILEATDTVIGLLGIKEEAPTAIFLDPLREGKPEESVNRVAQALGLPIQVRLVEVPIVYERERTPMFETSSLSRTGSDNQGFESIAAQVRLPAGLPLYSSRELVGFPIEIRISQRAYDQQATFITLIAHEISHVLLTSLQAPFAGSELHVDLAPLVLGLRPLVRAGRKLRREVGGRVVETTFGYIPDSLFETVVARIEFALRELLATRTELEQDLRRLDRDTQRAGLALRLGGHLLRALDRAPPDTTRPAHARRLADIHGEDTLGLHENRLADVRKAVGSLEDSLSSLRRPSALSARRLKTTSDSLRGVKSRCDTLAADIDSDVAVISASLPRYRLFWLRVSYLLRRLFTSTG